MAKWAGSLHISILKAAKINKKTNIAKYFCPFCKKNYINIQTYIQQTTTFYGIPKISYLFSGQGGRPAPPPPPPPPPHFPRSPAPLSFLALCNTSKANEQIIESKTTPEGRFNYQGPFFFHTEDGTRDMCRCVGF